MPNMNRIIQNNHLCMVNILYFSFACSPCVDIKKYIVLKYNCSLIVSFKVVTTVLAIIHLLLKSIFRSNGPC